MCRQGDITYIDMDAPLPPPGTWPLAALDAPHGQRRRDHGQWPAQASAHDDDAPGCMHMAGLLGDDDDGASEERESPRSKRRRARPGGGRSLGLSYHGGSDQSRLSWTSEAS